MSKYVLQTRNLSKIYKETNAVENVSLSLKKGQIYGFIGKNGAGKTTFIRMISGLAFPTSGSLSLFGKKNKNDLEVQRKRIGCMVEAPALYGSMTAKENLEVQRLQRGIPEKNAVDKALETVDLSDTGNKKVKSFSLGMRQRLAIAIALLSDPEFLILDEPTNGLDPMGIVEIRELLKKINKERRVTILISSHILSELYQLATDYIIIHEGKIIEELTLAELDEKCKKHIVIEVDNTSLAAAVIEDSLKTTNFHVMPNNKIKLYEYMDEISKVSSLLTQKGLNITQLNISADTLEGYFIKAIEGGERYV